MPQQLETLHPIFETEGQICQARTGHPLWINGTDRLWLVACGKVDLFLTRIEEGQPSGALHPLFRMPAGALLLGMPPADGWGMVAVGLADTRLLELPRARMMAQLHQHAHGPQTETTWLNHWLERLTACANGPLHAKASRELVHTATSWDDIDALNAALLTRLIEQRHAAQALEQQRMRMKESCERQNIQAAMHRLSAILDPQDKPNVVLTHQNSALFEACQLVGKASAIDFVQPQQLDASAGIKQDLLADIVEASRVRKRLVALKGSWWTQDQGHLLATLEDGLRPVALIQAPKGYELHDPEQGTVIPVTADIATTLAPFAHAFYRSFTGTAIGLWEMIRFGSQGCLRDYSTAMAMGAAVGLLGMVTPMATGMLFDVVIPASDRPQLLQLSMALVAGLLATAMFEVTRGIAMLRAEGKMDYTIQAAVWDRLLRLPSSFFRNYSAGDLAVRANGINAIRQMLSGNVMHTLMAAVFSIFNLGLLFYYNMSLALLALALVAVAIVFTTSTSLIRLRHERKLADIEGRISGLLFQLLGGIAKLRTTGAEGRAFFNWALLFASQQEHQFKATMVRNALGVFNAVFPVVANICIFAVVAFYLGDKANFSTGSFLAFNAAFGGFLGAMLGTTAAITAVLDIIPMYERSKPILQALPEVTGNKAHPGTLEGDIEIAHLSFSYKADGPTILKDVSMHIKAGEFVAVVGASGSGKSTLLRLLLGFEQASSGAIYYDSQDISSLDVGALRRQLGVVLQNGQLMSGDIFSNILGSAATLTLDDAWAAATQAGIADDIRAMPMGMHTVVSDGGGTLSGGQRQRLLIARAIVNRPRILLFDEATSALDNRAQELVSASLEQLRATRIVIAHRLSTIVNADRIFVLDQGQLVQTGSYDELIGCTGLFADLVRRQIV